jgi:hypothetical protein
MPWFLFYTYIVTIFFFFLYKCMLVQLFVHVCQDRFISSSELFWDCLFVNFYIFEFLSRTTGPILTILGTNQACSNEREHPSPRGDNSKRVKIQWNKKKKKSSFPEPAGQFKSNLEQIILGWLLNKGLGHLQRGGKKKKNIVGWFKTLLNQKSFLFTWKPPDIVQIQFVCV